MTTYLYIIQMILAVALIIIVMVGSKGSGVGSVFGGDSAVYNTRRGVDKLLFQITIGLSFVFFLISLLSVMIGG